MMLAAPASAVSMNLSSSGSCTTQPGFTSMSASSAKLRSRLTIESWVRNVELYLRLGGGSA